MKNLNKIYNFFTTRYYDNIKYNHSTAALLRIFFERANKTRQSVSNLGNVYRNSKWSDLKVQNIKFTHVNSFIWQLSLVLFIFISIFLIMFRLDYNTLSLFTNNITSTIWYFIDILNYTLALLLVTVYYVISLIKGNNNYSFDTNVNSSASYSHSNSTLHLNTKSSLTNSKSLLMKELFTSLDSLSDSGIKFNSGRTFLLPNTKGVSISKLESNLTSNSNLLSSEISYFCRVDELLNNNESYKKSISLNTLNNLQDKHILNSLVLSSINDSFSSAEYLRWLLKSSPLTEKLSSSLFNFTQAKSLVGKSTLNSGSSVNNIWASSNVDNIGSFNNVDIDSFVNALNSNINFFESSSLFLNKRYYFTMQPKYSATSLLDSNSKVINNANTNNNFILLKSILNSSLHQNLGGSFFDKSSLIYSNNYILNNLNTGFALSNASKNNFVITDSLNIFVIDLNSTRSSNVNNYKYYDYLSYTPYSAKTLKFL